MSQTAFQSQSSRGTCPHRHQRCLRHHSCIAAGSCTTLLAAHHHKLLPEHARTMDLRCTASRLSPTLTVGVTGRHPGTLPATQGPFVAQPVAPVRRTGTALRSASFAPAPTEGSTGGDRPGGSDYDELSDPRVRDAADVGEVDFDELLYDPGAEVPPYVGPLELRLAAGAGVGVFVTEDVPAGKPLLACHPLALLRASQPAEPDAGNRLDERQSDPDQRRGRPGAPPPSPVELAEALVDSYVSPLAAAWLEGLHDGEGKGGDGGAARLWRLRQLLRQPFGPDAATPDHDADPASGPGSRAPVFCPLSLEALTRVVALNAYCEPRTDPAVEALRSLDPEQLGGCVGLWPPFSLINHSCAPTASYGLVGNVMVVRAATDLEAGQEVSVSYFGRRALAPLDQRRSYLRQFYGFVCGCPRCTLEEQGLHGDQDDADPGPGANPDGEAAAGKRPTAEPAAADTRLPPGLTPFLGALHTTCSRVAAPHLMDLLSGRRWRQQPQQQDHGAGVEGDTEAGGEGDAAVPYDEPVSELEEEMKQMYAHLSDNWDKLLSVAASVAGGGSDAEEGEDDDENEEGQGPREEDAAGTSGGGSLTQQEVLWLEGSVFVVLDQLTTVVGLLGLLERVVQAAAGPGQERPGARSRGRGRGTQRGREGGRGVEEGRMEVEAAPEGLTAAAAVREITSRRWLVRQLPRRLMEPYVGLLTEGLDVASAVAPGSDLATAFAVRMLYGMRALYGKSSEEFREAELRCYDALSARYGILEYDTYERVLEVCCQHYRAEEVRLPGVSAVATTGDGSGGDSDGNESGRGRDADGMATLSGWEAANAGGVERGMVGLRAPAVPVEVEVEVMED